MWRQLERCSERHCRVVCRRAQGKGPSHRWGSAAGAVPDEGSRVLHVRIAKYCSHIACTAGGALVLKCVPTC